MRGLTRLAGWFLLLVPFVPLTLLFGEIERARGLVSPAEALLGLFVFGTLSVLGARLFPPRWPAAALGILERKRGPGYWAVGATALLLLALLLVTATSAFSKRPLLVDSVIQLFQARIFASGHLYAAAPPDEAFFAVQHMLVDGEKWYSQYPPGHSLLLAAGTLLDAAWLVPVALSIGTALLMFGFARRAFDRATARLTLMLFAAAPFFWFMGASHMNHVSALFFVAAFLFLLAVWEDRGSWPLMLGAGAAIGGALLSRPLTAAAVGLALSPFVLSAAVRRRDLASLAAGAVGVGIAVTLYMGYNAATTGDPFLPGYLKLWGAGHGLGFHPTPWGDVHSPVTGLRNELTDLALLSSLTFEWPIPALIPAGLLFAAGWSDGEWDRRLLWGFLALPAAYLFYWHRDAFLGPRYLYSGLAFILPLTARGLLEIFRRARGRMVWGGSAVTRVPAASTAGLLLLLSLAYSAGYSTPRRFHVYRTGLASMKVDLAAEASAHSMSGILVFVPVSWGNRLLARMRGLGVPAAAAERAYRTSEHCGLELLVRRAEAERWGGERTAAAIASLGPGGAKVPALSPLSNGDPTLRLNERGTPAVECLDEIAYDREETYGNFSPFLADQEPSLDGPLVIARDLRGRNERLRARYPDRPVWLFRPSGFRPIPFPRD